MIKSLRYYIKSLCIKKWLTLMKFRIRRYVIITLAFVVRCAIISETLTNEGTLNQVSESRNGEQGRDISGRSAKQCQLVKKDGGCDGKPRQSLSNFSLISDSVLPRPSHGLARR